MLLTDDERPGRARPQARRPRRASRSPHYEHTEIGYNYRLSNILAALGRAQLARLDDDDRAPPRAGASATAQLFGRRAWRADPRRRATTPRTTAG